MNEECDHKWVYDHKMLFMSNPPQRRKICKKCGKIEYEIVGNPFPRESEFDRLMEKFHSE